MEKSENRMNKWTDIGGGGGGELSRCVQLFCDPTDCSLPVSSVHGISQARILEWVAISFLSSIFPTQGSNLQCRWILYHWATGEAQTILLISQKKETGIKLVEFLNYADTSAIFYYFLFHFLFHLCVSFSLSFLSQTSGLCTKRLGF